MPSAFHPTEEGKSTQWYPGLHSCFLHVSSMLCSILLVYETSSISYMAVVCILHGRTVMSEGEMTDSFKLLSSELVKVTTHRAHT